MTIGYLDDLWHVRGRGVAANLLEVLLKASRRDHDHDAADRFPRISKCVRAAALSVGRFARDKRVPLPIHQELKLTIEGHKSLVFVCMAVRWRTSSGLNVLNQGGGEAAGDYGIDKNIDTISEDAKSLDRGHCCSVDKLNAGR